MSPLIDAIDREASTLPPQVQQEVLNFIGYLRARYQGQSDAAWLERAWGAAPAFPDRPAQEPLAEIKPL